MNYSLILLCAGSGKRTGLKYNKIFYKINNQTVYEMNISHFLEDNRCKQIIVVTKENEIDDIRTLVNDSRIEYVFGGKERQDSVYEGLKKVKENHVFIHDGARPFVTEEMINCGKKTVIACGTCVLGMPSKDTVKIIDENGFVESTPKRDKVWNVQTPQIFSYPDIYKAYQEAKKQGMQGITDDAMVMEQYGALKVRLEEGSYENIKITTPEDILLAEKILETLEKE